MLSLCSVLEEVHLGLTKKDNYIMWVSVTRSGNSIFVVKMASEVTSLHWRGHLNIIITTYPGNEFVNIPWYKDTLSYKKYSVFANGAQPVSVMHWLKTAEMLCMLETRSAATWVMLITGHSSWCR